VGSRSIGRSDRESSYATRRSTWIGIDPARVGPLSAGLRSTFARDLSRDAPHMEVTEEVPRTADRVCGEETNIAIQSRQLLDYVADFADHYSKDPTKPKCGVGDSAACVVNEGGCCTDLHSLFIALARARGIPARLQMGYRLLEKNVGKVVDPGYRCWAEYFVPEYGWVPADIVEADATDGLGRDRWFTGLTERRVHLNEGREFVLSPSQDSAGRINTMVIGYAEVDGIPARLLPDGDRAAQITRTVQFVEVDAAKEPALVRN
jgi:transglutaminase-like putative cysteine protease